VREDVRSAYDHSRTATELAPKLSVNINRCGGPLMPMGVVNQENGMSGPSTRRKNGECREVMFWLLLLGSWQFLASPGSKSGIIGALGAAGFLVYAWRTWTD